MPSTPKNRPLVIEIQGIGFPNKGAELMLCAVAERLYERFGEQVRLVCTPHRGSDESAWVMGLAGVRPLCDFRVKGWEIGWFFDRLPHRALRGLGLYAPRDIDLVLDASGLCFSDDFGTTRAVLGGARRLLRRARRGKPFVMLPQGFGPFASETTRAAMREVLGAAKQVYARDEISLGHLRALGEFPHLRQVPDMTIAYKVAPRPQFADLQEAVLVIPNQNMMTKGDAAKRAAYPDYLASLCRSITKGGAPVVCLNHEGFRDAGFCRTLVEAVPGMRLIEPRDPRAIKAAIGNAKMVVSSRFHGFVSALAQGVPAFCTSWNHKYAGVAREFGVPDAVLDMNLEEDSSKLKALLDSPGRLIEQRRLLEASGANLRGQVERMWDEVFERVSASLNHISLKL